jgi:hypothetical protein
MATEFLKIEISYEDYCSDNNFSVVPKIHVKFLFLKFSGHKQRFEAGKVHMKSWIKVPAST